MSNERFKSFQEFWPYYLGEHALPATRWMHFIGTTLALFWGVMAALTKTWAYIPVALVTAYGFAWISHFFIEKNRPATFTYPLWSFIGDWKMWAMMLTGRLGSELSRLSLRS